MTPRPRTGAWRGSCSVSSLAPRSCEWGGQCNTVDDRRARHIKSSQFHCVKVKTLNRFVMLMSSLMKIINHNSWRLNCPITALLPFQVHNDNRIFQSLFSNYPRVFHPDVHRYTFIPILSLERDQQFRPGSSSNAGLHSVKLFIGHLSSSRAFTLGQIIGSSRSEKKSELCWGVH